jgi:CMP-N-acetylneuraminic acid synthetase
MNILVTICARGGSKGIPGKNVKLLDGKPLIAYTIDTAQKFITQFKDGKSFVALSTDSQQIIDVSAAYGLNTEYRRSSELAGDKVGKIDVIKDLLLWYENKYNIIFDYILDLDVTSPLRTVDDLNEAFEIIKKNQEAINLFSVNPANRNPYFNMVEQNKKGFYQLIKKTNTVQLTRQQAPKVYDLNASFYFYKREFFTKRYKSAITDKSLIYIMPHMCFDLDHSIDFEFLSFLIENNKLDFQL